MNTYPSETAKYRHLTTKYCVGNGIDIGSGGDPVVPHAISIDLPDKEYNYYNSNQPPRGIIHYQGYAEKLPFKDNTLDFVYSSHLLEDFLDWDDILAEWLRVLKPGGHLIILVPDKKLWNVAIQKGQPPNCSHKHESYAGELTKIVTNNWFNLAATVRVIEDRLTDCWEGDYSILFVGVKL